MPKQSLQESLEVFAQTVTSKFRKTSRGQPEDQLRAPLETFLSAVGTNFGLPVTCVGETKLVDRLGRPDYSVHASELLAGYVELKAPGTGANTKSFKGHNRDQWKRFACLPNILYSDGNEWALYRDGKRIGKIVHLSGDIVCDGRKALVPKNAADLERLLRDFLSWTPLIPTSKSGKVDLKGLAALLAPLCRLLRDEVNDALTDPQSPLVRLAKDWRNCYSRTHLTNNFPMPTLRP